MKKFEIIFYKKSNGECPIEEFLMSLDSKMRAKVVGLLEILEEKGNLLREPYSTYVREDIFELRCQVGNNIIRVLYFFYYRKSIVLTNGFTKKTQRLPEKQIKLARKYKEDYQRRVERS